MAQVVYLPLLARIPERFAVVAVADLSSSLRDAVAARYGVPEHARYASAQALIEAGDLDAVVILTSGPHAAIAARALEAGLAVLCEKPLDYTRAAVDELAGTLARTGGRLLLGYMKQYDPAVAEASRILRESASSMGALRAVEVTVLHPSGEAQLAFAHPLPPATDIAASERARQSRAMSALREAALGAATAELGILYTDVLLGSLVHDLAVVRHLAGELTSVDHALTWPDDARPPSLALSGRVAGGARLSIAWHYLPRYPAYREHVRLHLERGSLELTFPTPYRLHLPTTLTVTSGAAETVHSLRFESVEEAFERQLLAFEALVREGRAPLAGVAEGRRDIVTCQAIVARLAQSRGLPLGGEAARGEAALREADHPEAGCA